MARICHVVRAEGAFQYASNTQSLYKRHLELAKANSENAWRYHIAHMIMPAYAREFHEPTACIDAAELSELIDKLQSYYWEQFASDNLKFGGVANDA